MSGVKSEQIENILEWEQGFPLSLHLTTLELHSLDKCNSKI